MKLPLLISVPHGGMNVPPEVSDICTLSREDIAADSDEGATAIYSNLEQHCEAYLTSDIARAVIDLNRPPDDIGGDGVIKSHTCWNVPIYRNFPDDALIQALLARYYFPYHEKLSAGAGNNAIKLGIDCHTMSASGPPVGPDPGQPRPLVCISNADGPVPRNGLRPWPTFSPQFSRTGLPSTHPSGAALLPDHMQLKCPGSRLKFPAPTHTRMSSRETACLKDCSVSVILSSWTDHKAFARFRK